MLITLLGVITSIIFFFLSAIHFYWAFGREWGFDSALPKDKSGKRLLSPGKASSIVCLLLSIASILIQIS